MRRLFPSQVTLDADEVLRINRIRVAQIYGIPPAMVDAMPVSDVDDTLNVMWADAREK